MRIGETTSRQSRSQRLGARLSAFRLDAGGATMIEYTLAASMLAVAVFASMGVVSDAVSKVFAVVTTAFGQVQ